MQILTKIYRAWKNKKGEEYKTKDGRPYERVSIQIDNKDYAGKWLSGFGADWNKDWKVGDKVNITIEEKDGFLNFSKVNEAHMLLQRIEKLEVDVKALRQFITITPNKTENAPEIEYPEANPEDIPFN